MLTTGHILNARCAVARDPAQTYGSEGDMILGDAGRQEGSSLPPHCHLFPLALLGEKVKPQCPRENKPTH